MRLDEAAGQLGAGESLTAALLGHYVCAFFGGRSRGVGFLLVYVRVWYWYVCGVGFTVSSTPVLVHCDVVVPPGRALGTTGRV